MPFFEQHNDAAAFEQGLRRRFQYNQQMRTDACRRG